MSITEIGFVLMAMIAAFFMGAFVVSHLDIELPARFQTGDSSLSRHSVNWLGAIALTAAVLICLV
jgi:hypothetical protein